MADDKDIEMIATPGSSQIAAAGYDKDTKELRVQFASGALYSYDGVPEEAFTSIVHGPSAGSAFHNLVKLAGYSYQRLS